MHPYFFLIKRCNIVIPDLELGEFGTNGLNSVALMPLACSLCSACVSSSTTIASSALSGLPVEDSTKMNDTTTLYEQEKKKIVDLN